MFSRVGAVLGRPMMLGIQASVYHRQSSKSFELKASINLGRLWQRQNRHDAARELLTPIYNWFTEGFGTTHLIEAKALLLDELQTAN